MGDEFPAKGAGRSAKARLKPSFDELVLKREFKAMAVVMVGAALACAP